LGDAIFHQGRKSAADVAPVVEVGHEVGKSTGEGGSGGGLGGYDPKSLSDYFAVQEVNHGAFDAGGANINT
jgi:hypothetical protein